MGSGKQAAIIEENGVRYELIAPRAAPLLCRVFGVAFFVLGLPMVLVFPPLGLILLAGGVTLFFAAPKRIKPKRKFMGFSALSLGGNPTFGGWNAAVHEGQSQVDRFERAAHQDVEILEWIPQTGFARVKGSGGEIYLTSLDHCACPDFEKRGRPCKHIYFLAQQMGYTSEDFYQNN